MSDVDVIFPVQRTRISSGVLTVSSFKSGIGVAFAAIGAYLNWKFPMKSIRPGSLLEEAENRFGQAKPGLGQTAQTILSASAKSSGPGRGVTANPAFSQFLVLRLSVLQTEIFSSSAATLTPRSRRQISSVRPQQNTQFRCAGTEFPAGVGSQSFDRKCRRHDAQSTLEVHGQQSRIRPRPAP